MADFLLLSALWLPRTYTPPQDYTALQEAGRGERERETEQETCLTMGPRARPDPARKRRGQGARAPAKPLPAAGQLFDHAPQPLRQLTAPYSTLAPRPGMVQSVPPWPAARGADSRTRTRCPPILTQRRMRRPPSSRAPPPDVSPGNLGNRVSNHVTEITNRRDVYCGTVPEFGQ